MTAETPTITKYGNLQRGDAYVPVMPGSYANVPVRVFTGRSRDFPDDTQVVLIARNSAPSGQMIRVIEGTEDDDDVAGHIFLQDKDCALDYSGITWNGTIESGFPGDQITKWIEVIPIDATALQRVLDILEIAAASPELLNVTEIEGAREAVVQQIDHWNARCE